MKRVVSILAILLISIAVSAYSAVLSNPGFEGGETGWYSWSDETMSGVTSGAASSDYKYNGTNSARRTIEGKTQGCYGQPFPVNTGETVTASAWIMSPDAKALSGGGEAYIRIEFWGTNGPLGAGHVESEHIKAATPWKKIQATGRVPTGATEARVLAFAKGIEGSKGEACFDDFEVSVQKGN